MVKRTSPTMGVKSFKRAVGSLAGQEGTASSEDERYNQHNINVLMPKGYLFCPRDNGRDGETRGGENHILAMREIKTR